MPLYVYEAKDPSRACDRCRGGFEVTQRLAEDPLAACPGCGAPVYRVIQAPGLGHSQTDLHYRAKRAGFNCLKRVDRGTFEKMY